MRLFTLSLAAVALTLATVAAPGNESSSTTNSAARPKPQSAVAVSLTAADREALQDLARRAEEEVRGNILAFWLKHSRDEERGGFYGEIDGNLKVSKNAPRGLLLTARTLWAFSNAYRHYRDPAYLKMARWAFADLEGRFWDEKHGGVFWSVKANGRPQETSKQTYAQSFAIYAYAEYFRATGDKLALERAIAIYRLMVEHAFDPVQGGYFEAFSREWDELPEGTRNLLGTTAPKSQNTMLHIMEAYTNLYRVWPDAGLRRQLTELVDRMATRVLNPETKHLHLLLATDWAPRSEEVSFGHDIEFSWLLSEAVDVLGDPALIERMRPLSVAIADVTKAQGFNATGGLYNESGPNGLTDASTDWWPQAESAVGFLNAYQLTGDTAYLATARRSWDFIERRIVDREHGEWYWGRDAKGRVPKRQPKVSTWKCPYHNSRACIELVERVHKLLGEPEPQH